MENNSENIDINKEKKDKEELLSNLRKICIFASIGAFVVALVNMLILGFFAAVIGIGFGGASGGESLIEIFAVCFVEIIKIFFSPSSGMLMWGIPILGIWLFYIFSIIFVNIYCGLGNKSKKAISGFSDIFFKLVIVIVVILVVVSVISSIMNYGNYNIGRVFSNEPSTPSAYSLTKYCFVYHDKFYYVGEENLKNKLYTLSLGGYIKQKVSSKDEFYGADFQIVYNDEAYFYSPDDTTNKKVNLSTKTITTLNNKYEYIAETMENGTIYTLEKKNKTDNCYYSILRKIDLNTNEVLSEHRTPEEIDQYSKYIFDYDNGNIYILGTTYDEKYYAIYKNEDIVYQFEETDKYGFPKPEFILAKNEFVYYIQNGYIYKLNTDKGEIEKTIPLKYLNIKRISSGNNHDNYFYANERIYSYNFETEEFDLFLTNVPKQPEMVYHINDTFIFTENVDNIACNDSKNLGSALIYDTVNKNTNNIPNVRKVSFDEETMYVVVSKSVGHCKIKKYSLSDF